MAKIKYTLRIEEKLLKEAKIRAIKESRPLNSIIEELLKNYLNLN